MVGIAIYLLLLIVGLTSGVCFDARSNWLSATPDVQLAVRCAFAGGYGGLVYCLRAIYLNASVKNNWDGRWIAWYIIRPLVSFIVGGVSYLFLKAGLFVLDSSHAPDASAVGFYALAFIAGLNVDRFLVKLESVAQATWGIRPSRTAEDSDRTQS